MKVRTMSKEAPFVNTIRKALAYYREDLSRRSVDGEGTCLYAGPGGRICAAALVTPPSLRDRLIEGNTIGEVMRLGGGLEADVDLYLLGRLQNVHDSGNLEESYWLDGELDQPINIRLIEAA